MIQHITSKHCKKGRQSILDKYLGEEKKTKKQIQRKTSTYIARRQKHMASHSTTHYAKKTSAQ